MKLSPHFMVVDDDPVNNMLCQFGIRKVQKDADIKMFTEPEDALRMIVKSYSQPAPSIFTILFLDINMPSMTGWDFLAVFKDYDDYIKEQFKIFIVSSSVDERDKERAGVTELVSGFLSKPLKTEVIRQIVSDYESDHSTT